MSDNTWKEYFEKTKGAKPRPLLVKAVEFVESRDNALDLGAGAFNDVRYLLSKGFNYVTAVDKTALAEGVLQYFPSDKISYIISSFEDFNFLENTYDLVNAQYALPFNPKKSFQRVFVSMLNSIKSGGIFVGQLFGDRDEWNTENSEYTFHKKEEAQKLMSSLKIIEFTEEEQQGDTVTGKSKHWHVFHIIARK